MHKGGVQMKVSAIVNYPVFVAVDIDDDVNETEIDNILFETADSIFESSTIKPEIRNKTITRRSE
jgi:hypothetical protein